MIGIDLFSGAGGMSIGAMAAGIDIRVAVESDPNAAATYKANHPNVLMIEDDIRNVTDLSPMEFEEETVIFGGPPCQGFSTSNQRNRSSKNPNNWLFQEFLRIIKNTYPDWVVFENVKGILETEDAKFLNSVKTGLADLGYTLSTTVLNAADFGIPQKRSRLFIIASKHGKHVEFTTPKHTAQVTVKDAIYDLPKLENGESLQRAKYRNVKPSNYAKSMRKDLNITSNHLVTRNADYILERYKHIPAGGNWENIPDHLMKNYTDKSRCHTGIYRRLKWDEPSVVIGNYRKNMLIHPEQNRGLSVREAARLQSFPDWFTFHGTIGFQQQQVGNAVPPMLAREVFKKLLKISNQISGSTMAAE